jgi:hypothetical protein
MKYELTIFQSAFDNKTHRKASFDTWDEFVELLEGLSTKYGEKGGKNSSALISPAIFAEGTTRSNVNTLHWGGWCAVDVDEHSFAPDLDALKNELTTRFSDLDFVCYSTASSRHDYYKFRLVFRIEETIPNDKIKSFWYALNTDIGEIGDPQTKDLARMYYIPAVYPGAFNFFFKHSGGTSIDPTALISKHPYVTKTGNSFLDRLPEEMQKAVIQHRKNSMTETNISWTDYRDCPFFPKRLAIEYGGIAEGGWYHKMYQIMVATAGTAIKRGYPITAKQVADLCRQLDNDNGKWYTSRPLEVEADRAVEYAYRNN